ncbi:MAG: hypothetical protein HOP15_13945 [Planctomycetes bacterium]|nr:hypothetical protein [Planctomycetota bacterium]
MNAPVVPGGYVGFWKVSADGSRVFYAGWPVTVGMNEVYDVPLDGSQASRALSAPFLPGRGCFPNASFQLSPTETRVLYLADQDTDEMQELFSVPTDGSRVSTKLSGPLIAQGDVLDFQQTPNGTRVVYRADATANNLYHLFSAPADVSTPPVQLHPQMAFEFKVTPDSSRVVFRASQLNSVPVDGSAPAQLLSNSGVTEYVGEFAITPDGQRAVFEGGYWYPDPVTEDELARGLYSVPLDGSGPVLELIEPIEATFSLSYPAEFLITPDSTRAVFHSLVDGQLFGAHTAGLTPSVRLNDLPFANTVRSFRLSSDGSQVVFVAGSGGGHALYRVPVDGSATPVALTPLYPAGLLDNLEVSASGRVVYVRLPFNSSIHAELYSVRLDGMLAPVRLSDPPASGSGIGNPDFTSGPRLWISPDAGWVVYLAHQDASRVVELFCAPIDGRHPAQRVSAPMVAGGDVYSVQFVPSALRLVYSADQETDGTNELFTSSYGARVPHGPPQPPTKGLQASGNPGSATMTAP